MLRGSTGVSWLYYPSFIAFLLVSRKYISDGMFHTAMSSGSLRVLNPARSHLAPASSINSPLVFQVCFPCHLLPTLRGFSPKDWIQKRPQPPQSLSSPYQQKQTRRSCLFWYFCMSIAKKRKKEKTSQGYSKVYKIFSLWSVTEVLGSFQDVK